MCPQKFSYRFWFTNIFLQSCLNHRCSTGKHGIRRGFRCQSKGLVLNFSGGFAPTPLYLSRLWRKPVLLRACLVVLFFTQSKYQATLVPKSFTSPKTQTSLKILEITMLLLPKQCTTMHDKVCVSPSQFAVFLRGHPKAFHFPKWAVLTQLWAVLNDKMGSSKISLLGYSTPKSAISEHFQQRMQLNHYENWYLSWVTQWLL